MGEICLWQDAKPLQYLQGTAYNMEKMKPSSVASNCMVTENSKVVVILEVCARKISKRKSQPRISEEPASDYCPSTEPGPPSEFKRGITANH